MADAATIAANLRAVNERIDAAARRARRDPGAVTLVGVSKTKPLGDLLAAWDAGLRHFGENRVQEAETKVAVVAGATWHLVGPLQSNKAKRALVAFAVIESVDTVELAERLDRLAGGVRPSQRMPVLLQVNVDGDPAKAGFDPDALAADLPRLAGLGHLELRGLMTVGRLVERAEDARPTFVALRELSERLRSSSQGEGSAAGSTGGSIALGPGLSMGMSDDYPIAIEEGATIVRVGRALFGERHHP
jgi:pyridoxal phosphate enzyme (YggS family)